MLRCRAMIISETVKDGEVVAIAGDIAVVAIGCGDQSTCGACKLSGVCASSETTEVEARVEGGIKIAAGDNVIVVGRVKGWMASWLMLAGGPCLVVLAVVVAGFFIGLSELMIGGVAVATIALYYVILWASRRRLGKRVEWEIIESNKTK